jgi:Zn-dependent protease
MTSSPATAPPAAARPNNLVGAAVLALWLASGGALAAGFPPGPLTFAFVVLGWVLAVMAHEFAHAGVAYLAGDHTIVEKGYLSFDPRRYGDLRTSLLIPLIALALGGIGFPGGAVYLRNDLMRGRLWRSAASLAGPAATLLVLAVLALVLNLWPSMAPPGPAYDALAFLAYLQATALILNLLPIPGLDGFNALRPFLPKGWAPALRQLQGLTMIGLLLVVFFVPGAGRALFLTAASITGAFGVPMSAWIAGYQAFHFWR